MRFISQFINVWLLFGFQTIMFSWDLYHFFVFCKVSNHDFWVEIFGFLMSQIIHRSQVLGFEQKVIGFTFFDPPRRMDPWRSPEHTWDVTSLYLNMYIYIYDIPLHGQTTRKCENTNPSNCQLTLWICCSVFDIFHTLCLRVRHLLSWAPWGPWVTWVTWVRGPFMDVLQSQHRLGEPAEDLLRRFIWVRQYQLVPPRNGKSWFINPCKPY